MFGHNEVGAISYDDLSIVINEKSFIEDESVPRDAQVIDHTWQYVNKGGTPDRRFSNNRQIPVCLYEELWLNSPSGLNEVIQLSRTGLGAELDGALQRMADLVAKAAAMPPPAVPAPEEPVPKDIAPSRRIDRDTEQQATPASIPTHSAGPDGVFNVVFDVLCCLMVADGRASSSEKKRIHELMTKVRSPWSDSEIHDRIAAFIDRVQKDGYRRTLSVVLKEVEIFRRIGKQDVLLKCLDALAQADEKLTVRELQLCERVKAVVEEVPA